MKKAVITFVLVFLLVFNVVSAADETSSCTGFWGSLKCFFLGDASKRSAIGGKAWWDGNLAGIGW